MDEYIKREAALALVKPDAPEDEKVAVTIATAKNSFGALYSVRLPPTLHRCVMDGGYPMATVIIGHITAQYARGKMDTRLTNAITSAPTVARRWTEATTVRLIDANALMEEAYAEGAYGYVDAKQIADAPIIDAVEVTRCRNCIGRSTWYNDAEYGCAVCGMSGMYPKSEDGFCSYGIRKDGDEG